MEPNSPNKFLGLSLAAFTLIAVVAITVYFEQQPATTVADTTPTSVVADVPAVTPPTQDVIPPVDSSTPPTTPTTPPVDDTKTKPVTKPTVATTQYKNGTYTAVGSYDSPGGPDKIGVTLTIADDKIVDSTLSLQPGDNTSSRFQNIFASGYKDQVVGKDLATLQIDKVSRSSLTPIGFNAAVEQIRTEAKA